MRNCRVARVNDNMHTPPFPGINHPSAFQERSQKGGDVAVRLS